MVEQIAIGDGYAAAHRKGVGGTAGRVLVVPPFGVAASVLEFVGDELASHGFESIILDVRNHVGAGSGTMRNYCVSTVAQDCREAIERFEPTAVVGLSLGARALLRAVATTPASPTAVLVIPVVDLRSTLQTVLGWDVVTRADLPAVERVLGHRVEAPAFVNDAILHDLFSSSGTAADLANHGGRVTLLPADADPWVDLQTVKAVADSAWVAGASVDVVPVPGDQHELHKHPELALRMVSALVNEVVRSHRLVVAAA